MKFIENPFEFFIMSNYNFSLFGAIFGFFIVLWINTRLEKSSITKYIDGIMLSFLLTLSIGFAGSLLGGQVYGKETTFGIEILYTHPFTPVPYQVPIFPLSIAYSICSFTLFSVLYILSTTIHIRGFIGYLGLLIFGAFTLILESFSGKYDILSSYVSFNLNQVFSLIVITIAIAQLYKIYKTDASTRDIITQQE